MMGSQLAIVALVLGIGAITGHVDSWANTARAISYTTMVTIGGTLAALIGAQIMHMERWWTASLGLFLCLQLISGITSLALSQALSLGARTNSPTPLSPLAHTLLATFLFTRCAAPRPT